VRATRFHRGNDDHWRGVISMRLSAELAFSRWPSDAEADRLALDGTNWINADRIIKEDLTMAEHWMHEKWAAAEDFWYSGKVTLIGS